MEDSSIQDQGWRGVSFWGLEEENFDLVSPKTSDDDDIGSYSDSGSVQQRLKYDFYSSFRHFLLRQLMNWRFAQAARNALEQIREEPDENNFTAQHIMG